MVSAIVALLKEICEQIQAERGDLVAAVDIRKALPVLFNEYRICSFDHSVEAFAGWLLANHPIQLVLYLRNLTGKVGKTDLQQLYRRMELEVDAISRAILNADTTIALARSSNDQLQEEIEQLRLELAEEKKVRRKAERQAYRWKNRAKGHLQERMWLWFNRQRILL